MTTLSTTAETPAPEIHSPKLKGEYVESLFLSKMLSLGYTVCKPWGDSARFDFIIEKPGRLPLRIQVKSCWRRTGNHYAFRTTGNTPRHPTYTALDLDFIAALVVPLNLWYIVPISAISTGQSFFYVFPNEERETRNEKLLSYEEFRDAWRLLL